jgi:hypothetical protein
MDAGYHVAVTRAGTPHERLSAGNPTETDAVNCPQCAGGSLVLEGTPPRGTLTDLPNCADLWLVASDGRG